MHLNYIIPYRARIDQVFREKEIELLLNNIYEVLSINTNFSYNIYVIEQYNDDLFNRGILLNIGFIEINLNQNIENSIFIHCNTDYRLPVGPLPEIFHDIPNGFIDIHGFPSATLGGFVLFDRKSFIDCNGFPNSMYGWGGEDWAIWRRILISKINISRPENLYNKWIIENSSHIRDNRYERFNRIKANKNNTLTDIFIDGLNNCHYSIIDHFNKNNISWYRVNFDYKNMVNYE